MFRFRPNKQTSCLVSYIGFWWSCVARFFVFEIYAIKKLSPKFYCRFPECIPIPRLFVRILWWWRPPLILGAPFFSTIFQSGLRKKNFHFSSLTQLILFLFSSFVSVLNWIFERIFSFENFYISSEQPLNNNRTKKV